MPSRTLLVIHPGALGDLVSLYPLLQALRRHHRSLTLLCQAPLGRLSQALGVADAWLAIEAAWVASLFAGAPGREARQRLSGFSRILLFFRSEAPLAGLTSACGADICRVPPRPPADQRRHVAAHALAHLLDCGLLDARDAEILRRPSTPAAAPPPAAGAAVLLHPGAGSRRKRWPLAGFCEAAERIAARGLSPEFILGPAEQDLVPALTGLRHRLHRPGDLLELTALFRSAAAYVGNDSGASHLAAWLGLPAVVIFGPSDPLRWRPAGPAVEVVAPPRDCTPCFETDADSCGESDCLARISADEVLAALCRVTGRADGKE
jgi:ADP-heptose:LPS heptosyltransferase